MIFFLIIRGVKIPYKKKIIYSAIVLLSVSLLGLGHFKEITLGIVYMQMPRLLFNLKNISTGSMQANGVIHLMSLD